MLTKGAHCLGGMEALWGLWSLEQTYLHCDLKRQLLQARTNLKAGCSAHRQHCAR